jgi:hypothetical protein
MNTNEPTITVNEDTTLEEIIRQLDELNLLDKPWIIEYEYRIYYDASGNITATSPTVKDAEMYGFTGNYIIVDEDTYKSVFVEVHKYIVHNSKITVKKDNATQTPQLEKSQTGFKTVKNVPGIILEDGETYKDIEYYDYKNR